MTSNDSGNLIANRPPHRDRKGLKISAAVVFCLDGPAGPIMHERLTATIENCGVDYGIIFVNDASPGDARKVLAGIATRNPKAIVMNHLRIFKSQNAASDGPCG